MRESTHRDARRADQIVVATRRVAANRASGIVGGRAAPDTVANLVLRADGGTLDDPLALESNACIAQCVFFACRVVVKTAGVGGDRSAGTVSGIINDALCAAGAVGYTVLGVSLDAYVVRCGVRWLFAHASLQT